MLLDVVIMAEMISNIKCKDEILPLEFLLQRLILATPTTIIIEPIICNIPALSLKITIPKTKDNAAERTVVIVTSDMSADFKTLRIINQLKAIKKPFKAKIGTNFQGIAIPKDIQIKLSIKATEENKTKMVVSPLFRKEIFLKTLLKPMIIAYSKVNNISMTNIINIKNIFCNKKEQPPLKLVVHFTEMLFIDWFIYYIFSNPTSQALIHQV